MTTNFTTADIIGTLTAALAMSLFFFAPGYVLGSVANLLNFRQRRPVTRSVMAVTLSIACFPILIYLLERYIPRVIWAFYGLIWTAFAVIVIREFLRCGFRVRRPSRYVWLGGIAICIWLVIGIGSLVDVQLKDRLYFSVPAYDYSIRTAFTAAVSRSFPPTNPFFASSPPVPLRYHYFWMLPSSLTVQLTGLSPREVTFGATLWCGIGLMALIAIYIRFFSRQKLRIERKALIGIGLLLVTGLDILPTLLLLALKPHVVLPDMEWWNAPQIASWANSMIWVPHHVAAVIACLMGFLLLCFDRKKSFAGAFIAALCFASATGLSVYVTFTFAIFLVAWAIIHIARRDWPEVRHLVIAGVLATLLGLGFLYSLAGPGDGHVFAQFAFRKFSFATRLLAEHGISGRYLALATSALLLPLNYFLELGFFLLVGINRLIRVRRGGIEWTREELAAWTLVGTSFFVGTFIRSATIANNDLGFRCFLFAQFVLLLWAVPVIDDWWAERKTSQIRSQPALSSRALVFTCLVLGLAATAYQITNLRLYPIVADQTRAPGYHAGWLDSDGQLGKRTFALRAAYTKLNHELPGQAVIQFNPLTPSYLPHLLYAYHPAAAVGEDCGTAFGGRPQDCRSRIRDLSDIYEGTTAISELNRDCARLGIDVVLVEDTDPAWADSSSWVWHGTPLIANSYVRAFRCRELPMKSAASAESTAPADPGDRR